MARKALRKIIYILLWVLYPITYLVKRDKNLWLFGTNFNIYADNPKYLFEYISNNKPNLTAIWISGNRNTVKQILQNGYKAKWRYSLSGMYLAAKAGVFIYSHEVVNVNLWLKKSAFQFNTWHGVGLKKVAASQDKGKAAFIYNPKNTFQKIYRAIHSPQVLDKSFYMLATSKTIRKNYSQSFQIAESKFVIAGYPRLQPFYENPKKPEDWNKFSKVVIYMPTFRDLNPQFLSNAIPNPEKLNEVCEKLNMLFVFKLHPFTAQAETNRFKGFSNLTVMDYGTDVYPLLKHTHAMISDYSSVFVDYAVLKKPIIIYAYDLEDYLKNNRNLYFNFNDLTHKKQIQNFELLLSSLSNLEENSIPIDYLNNLFWEKDSRYASQQITNWIVSKLNQIGD